MDKKILAETGRDFQKVKRVDPQLYREDESYLKAWHAKMHKQAGREVSLHKQETAPEGHGGGLHHHPQNCDCPAHHHSGGMLGDGRVHLRDLEKRGVGRKDF